MLTKIKALFRKKLPTIEAETIRLCKGCKWYKKDDSAFWDKCLNPALNRLDVSIEENLVRGGGEKALIYRYCDSMRLLDSFCGKKGHYWETKE